MHFEIISSEFRKHANVLQFELIVLLAATGSLDANNEVCIG